MLPKTNMNFEYGHDILQGAGLADLCRGLWNRGIRN